MIIFGVLWKVVVSLDG